MRRTAALVAAVGGAAAVIALAGLPTPVHQSAYAPPSSTDPTTTIASSIASGRLLFVGASYSIGLGATGPSASIPAVLARSLHRQYRLDAVSGTGYQNPGPHREGTFLDRIRSEPVDPQPRIVLIQGGRDDVRYPPASEYAAVVATVKAAQARFPQAQVVLLGPIPASLPVSPAVLALREQIAAAAASVGAGFIDPITARWITPENARRFRGPVPGHPNDAGYAYLADRLREALPDALRSTAPPRSPAADPSPAATAASFTPH